MADTVIYLVRHAETEADGTRDPHLNVVGDVRARWLATYFRGRGIEKIYSTDLNRTRETAQYTAGQFNRPIDTYDPDDLEGFAEELRGLDSIAVVFGHSNTTPELVNHLIGEERFQWLQHWQYDMIFRVFIGSNGETRVSIDYSQPRSFYGDDPGEN